MPQKISGKIAKIEAEPDISMLISGKITVVCTDQNNERQPLSVILYIGDYEKTVMALLRGVVVSLTVNINNDKNTMPCDKLLIIGKKVNSNSLFSPYPGTAKQTISGFFSV